MVLITNKIDLKILKDSKVFNNFPGIAINKV